MKGNQVVVNPIPAPLVTAQRAAYAAYQTLCNLAPPRLTGECLKQLALRAPIYSLACNGPDTLAKAAVLTAVKLYEKMGDEFLSKAGLTKLNLLVKLDVLAQVDGVPEETLRSAREAGHSQVMVMVNPKKVSEFRYE